MKAGRLFRILWLIIASAQCYLFFARGSYELTEVPFLLLSCFAYGISVGSDGLLGTKCQTQAQDADLDRKLLTGEWLKDLGPEKVCLEESDIQAATNYMVAVDYWQQACVLSASIGEMARSSTDLFDSRNSSVEQLQNELHSCVNKGIEYVDKALTVKPDFWEAMAYKSLLIREKQKDSSVIAEKQACEEEAMRLAGCVSELSKRVPPISLEVSIAPPPPLPSVLAST